LGTKARQGPMASNPRPWRGGHPPCRCLPKRHLMA